MSATLERTTDARLRATHGTTVKVNKCNYSNESACPLLVAARITIADRLHDSVIQELFALSLGLESLSKQALVLVGSIRDEVFGLRVDTDLSLREELELAVKSFALVATIDVREVAIVASGIHADIRDVVKEAVSNAIRHGKAKRVTVDVRRVDHAVEVEIVDDGTGCAPTNGGVGGLGGMARRANWYGGTLRLQPNASGGMSVQWKIPTKEENDD